MADTEPLTPAHPQPFVVTLPGEIDMANARQVRQRLYAALAAGAPIVVADMAATRFCDSMGLRALVLAHKRATASGAELRVAVTSKDILHFWPSPNWTQSCASIPAPGKHWPAAWGNDQGVPARVAGVYHTERRPGPAR
jgi:anti-anti-sigma factor